MATTTLAIPGQLLGPASKYKPGPGVHLYEANLYSSLLGTVAIAQPAYQSSSSSSSAGQGPSKRITRITQNLPSRAAGASAPAELPTISVSRGVAGGVGAVGPKKQREVLPQVGNTVLCRVTRITPRQAVVAILVCGDTVLEAEWQGVIRVQDVRATEKDRVKVYESFRPGDIVRASVVSVLTCVYGRARGVFDARVYMCACVCVFAHRMLTICCRFPSATRQTTTCPRRVMSSG